MPTGSMPPCQGCVSSTTPAAAISVQRLRPLPGPYIDTVSGPRNSIALAVPSGMRAIAIMKSSSRPAVTTPSAELSEQVYRQGQRKLDTGHGGKRHQRSALGAAQAVSDGPGKVCWQAHDPLPRPG